MKLKNYPNREYSGNCTALTHSVKNFSVLYLFGWSMFQLYSKNDLSFIFKLKKTTLNNLRKCVIEVDRDFVALNDQQM